MVKFSTETESLSRYGMSRLLLETFDLKKGSVGSILQNLLNAARLHLAMEVAFISEFEGERRVFRFVDQAEEVQLLKVGSSDPLDESYCRKVVDGLLPQLIHDAQKLQAALEIPATRKLGIGAHVSVPIRFSDGSVFGTFCSFSFLADHTLNERDIALMRVLADIAAGLIEKDIERARVEQAQRNRIERLLDSGEMTSVWQPIVEIASGRVVGVESLARFPAGQNRGPAEWFEEARQIGLGERLEAKAIENGLKVLDHLPPEIYLTLNVSAEAFLEGTIGEMLGRLPVERLAVEITEHDIVEDYEALYAALAPLRAKGLSLAVDDAGAGYASFRHILRLRPDIIKLDMSLTRDIDRDVSRRALASSLVLFAKAIQARLVAEGVETRSELDALVDLGVEAAQGYYLHRPKSLEDLKQLLD
jgi:EAL domain-containing protein (putative c-di-GMP-specific phosphodiesterase class I)